MGVEIGDIAPDFTLVDENGEKVTLSELRGRNAVLVFYPLDFSPVCTKELKDISAVADRYQAYGAEVYGISVDSRWCHAAFKRDELQALASKAGLSNARVRQHRPWARLSLVAPV